MFLDSLNPGYSDSLLFILKPFSDSTVFTESMNQTSVLLEIAWAQAQFISYVDAN